MGCFVHSTLELLLCIAVLLMLPGNTVVTCI